MGDMKFIGKMDIIWMNHNGIEEKPNLMYIIILYWSENPSMNPRINSKIIIILNILFIMKSCSEDNNHINQDPEVIANILSVIIGIKE